MLNEQKTGVRCAATNKNGTPCRQFVDATRGNDANGLCVAHNRRRAAQAAVAVTALERSGSPVSAPAPDVPENSGSSPRGDQLHVAPETPDPGLLTRRQQRIDRLRLRRQLDLNIPMTRRGLRARIVDIDNDY